MPRVTDAPGVIAPRRTIYVRLSEIKPAWRNPKKHILADIVTSIQTFGFTNPVLRCDRVGRLAAGHGRVTALVNMKAAGDPMPDGLVMDDDGEWCVPVTTGWASKGDLELEAYIIADNQLTENGGWDNFMLSEMLHDIHGYAPDLFEATGVDAERMEELIRVSSPERWDAEAEAAKDGAGDGGISKDPDEGPAGGKPRPSSVTCPHCGGDFIPREPR